MKGDGAVSAELLRSELLALAGVADARVETAGEAPTGVHIRLAPETNADAVRSEIQRILAAHGMRSRVAVGSESEPASTPVEAPLAGEVPLSPPTAGATAAGLESVRVEESASGVIVTATAGDGRMETVMGAATEEDLVRTVVAAVGTLARGIAPDVVAVEWTEAAGSEVVTVVVDGPEGSRSAGASLVCATRPFALGRATWQALRQG